MRTQLLDIPDWHYPETARDCACIAVRGIPYRHSAAKFWTRLVDEAREAFADCSRIDLIAVTAEALEPRRLHPQRELEEAIDELLDADMEAVMRETLAELSLLGPPPPVEVRLFEDAVLRFKGQLPLDACDAETFTYLAAWLLEWAEIPHAAWSRPHLEGQLVAADKSRDRTYRLAFETRDTPLREGIHRRTLSVYPQVAA